MSILRSVRLATVVLTTVIVGCGRGAQVNEVVLCPGASIAVTVGDAPFSIASTGQLDRQVTTGGVERKIRLIPRTERWFGSLGLYNPGAGAAGIHVIMEEGVQHFSALEDLQYWLQSEQRRLPIEFTADGLVVAASFQARPPGVSVGPESAMIVEVWQLLVNGKPPSNLVGAHRERFNNIRLPSQTCSSPKPFVASSSSMIDGRRYSGRSLDIMKERGFTADAVERLIKTGERTEVNGRITYRDNAATSEISFVDTLPDGTVAQIG